MRERRKPAERRCEIADAVLKIVTERGLGRLTAAEIAREVGVTDAALFHHFGTMDDIVLAAIDRVGEVLFQDLPHGGAPLARLGEFFRQRVSVINRHQGAGRMVLSDVLAQIAPPAGTAKVRSFRKRSVDLIRSCLVEAHHDGSLAGGVEVPEATVLVLGALMALTQARDMVATNGSVDALAAKVWQRLERILRGEPAAVRPPPGGADVARGSNDASADPAPAPAVSHARRSRR